MKKETLENKPIAEGLFQLKKIAGKGGWTYTEVPEVQPDRQAPFGWVKVKGSIEGVALRRYKLMPMGNGQLFLPVKAEIRKKINKKVGDWVQVVLYLDRNALEIPEEIRICLQEAGTYERFLELPENEQENWVKKIETSKRADTKVKRILELIEAMKK